MTSSTLEKSGSDSLFASGQKALEMRLFRSWAGGIRNQSPPSEKAAPWVFVYRPLCHPSAVCLCLFHQSVSLIALERCCFGPFTDREGKAPKKEMTCLGPHRFVAKP